MINPILKGQKVRIAIMAILLGAACFFTYYFHAVLGIGTVFTHFFYIPIILASLWWKRKGLLVAIFLAVVLILGHSFLRPDVLAINDYFRALMFIGVSLVTVMLSERIAKTEKALRQTVDYTRHLIESSPGFQMTLDKDSRIMDVNKAFEEIVGRSRKDVIGTSIYEYLPKEPTEKAIAEIFEKKKMRDIEITAKIPGKRDLICNFSGTVFTTPEGELGIYATGRDITERKRAEERIEHLNLVLCAIRNVNQLIAKEKDRDRLLKGGCHALIETRGYYNAWFAVIDESGKLVTTAEAGLGEDFLPMVERLKRGELPACGQKALKQSGVVVTKDPPSTCVDCPLAKSYVGEGAMTVRLEHGGKMYGLLTVSIPAEFTADEEEQALFKELAGDVAFALYDMELEEVRKQAEKTLKQYAEQLEEVNIRLQEADRLKSIFLASMSHELRTPLNSIIGFTGIILQGLVGELNEEQRKQLTMVKNSANHLLSLINDLLDISKIEAGKVELAIEEFDLSALVLEVKDSFAVAAEEKGLEMSLKTPERLVIKSDERKTKQVIMNLVSNAVKFTDEGKIEIKLTKKDRMAEISVKDTGIGIKRKYMNELFKAFSQIPTEGKPKQEGTGLGLYLSKKIASLLGGEINVESEVGKGSVFTFTLPIVYTGEDKRKNR